MEMTLEGKKGGEFNTRGGGGKWIEMPRREEGQWTLSQRYVMVT